MGLMKKRPPKVEKFPIMIYPKEDTARTARVEELKRLIAVAAERRQQELETTKGLERELMELLTQGFARQKKPKPDLGPVPKDWKPARLVRREKKRAAQIQKDLGVKGNRKRVVDDIITKDDFNPDLMNPENWSKK